MNGNRKSAKLDITRRNFLLRNRLGGEQAGFRTFGELRHDTQLDQIKAADKIDKHEKILLFSKLEKGVYLSGDSQRASHCCLFNVIVAFEWNPGYYELELLRNTCDEAANLLFDVTDGYMTFNRIIIGGPELMKCADIQIFASNRLFPRAWVNGLHIEKKYQPIRVGRGYWRKNTGRAEPWHKNLGAAVLVHEWLHYAVGLKDDYVHLEGGKYALPEASPAVNTLMANLESSELLGDREWRQLHNNKIFDWLKIPANRRPQNIPPDESPAARFTLVGTAKEDPEDDRQVWLDWKDADLDDKMAPNHCWVFVLISKDPEHPFNTPVQLIAQGSYEILPEGYRIIGARKDAFIILIGHEPNTNAPKVLYSQITGFRGSTIEFWAAGWQHATPTDCQIPFVSVSIADEQIMPPYKVNVDIVNQDHRDWKPTLFSLGEQRAIGNGEVEALDGCVLLVSSNDGRHELTIANFSIGGSPGAAYPASPNPVPAGSSDGNAMIFFYEKAARDKNEANVEQTTALEDSALRIITTTNLLGSSDNIGFGPRSYTFTVMPNKTLPTGDKGPKFNPTLVLYFDIDTKKDHEGAKLKIYRLVQSNWVEIEEQYQWEDPVRQLVAAQLNRETALGLFQDPPESECYRLFLV